MTVLEWSDALSLDFARAAIALLQACVASRPVS